jgi:protein-disulfide isomerase
MSIKPKLAICIPVLALVLGCPPPETTEPAVGETTEPAVGEVGDATAAAEINGKSVTLAELDAHIKEELFDQATKGQDPMQLYELRSKSLEEMINQRLLEAEAAPRGLTTEELLREETKEQSVVAEEDLLAFFEQNKARLGDATFEDMKPRILAHLQQQRGSTAAKEYIEGLRAKAAIEIHIDAPRAEVRAIGPSLGPEDAPVTIVEFSDYQCPFCSRAEPVIKQILERYPSEVRLVFRHFPLDRIHPQARGAAEAAACANEQDRFWDYHRRLFIPGTKFDPESLQQYASDLELDVEAFRTCVEERRYQAAVETDVREGREAGITGTPGFFVNGILLKGAKPLDDFVALIDKELGRS